MHTRNRCHWRLFPRTPLSHTHTHTYIYYNAWSHTGAIQRAVSTPSRTSASLFLFQFLILVSLFLSASPSPFQSIHSLFILTAPHRESTKQSRSAPPGFLGINSLIHDNKPSPTPELHVFYLPSDSANVATHSATWSTFFLPAYLHVSLLKIIKDITSS